LSGKNQSSYNFLYKSCKSKKEKQGLTIYKDKTLNREELIFSLEEKNLKIIMGGPYNGVKI